MFDANVEWLVERGRPDQWGREPWSTDAQKSSFVSEILTNGVFTAAEVDGRMAGASVVADHPMPYVPAADEPERYLKLLIGSPSHRGKGIGSHLIRLAREFTVRDGIGLLRVDCWAGGDRRLVGYYIGEGFVPTDEIEVRAGTSVQVFEWRPARIG